MWSQMMSTPLYTTLWKVELTLFIWAASAATMESSAVLYGSFVVSNANSSAGSAARSNSSGGSCRVELPLLPPQSGAPPVW